MKRTLAFSDLPTGATGDAYASLAALIAPDTLGARARILAIAVGPSDGTPSDVNLSVRLERVDNRSATGASDGTAGSTTSASAMARADSAARDGLITGGTGYTAEPTAFGPALFEAGLNSRGTLLRTWAPEEAPILDRNQIMALRAAVRSGGAVNLSGCIEFEEF